MLRSHYFKRILTLCLLIYLTFFLLILRVLIAPGTLQWAEEGETELSSFFQTQISKNLTEIRNTTYPKVSREDAFLAWDYEEIMDAVDMPYRNISILMWTNYYHNRDLTDHVRNEAPIPTWCNVTFDRRKLERGGLEREESLADILKEGRLGSLDTYFCDVSRNPATKKIVVSLRDERELDSIKTSQKCVSRDPILPSLKKSRIFVSQAVVFHIPGTDLNLNDLPKRDPNQLWVYYIIEPPLYMNRAAQQLDRLFNRTMTYRLDSDYPCPYGYIAQRRTSLKHNPYMFHSLNVPRASREHAIALPPLDGKTKLVAWMVSHCNTYSKRENLVRELEKHISVDIYGSCGKLSCDKSKEEGCYEKLGQQYKFYLSFENSVCSDYITEKFSNALKYNLVPIVYGGGNYTKILPHPKSFIDVRDFGSAESLVKYLRYLDGNNTAYAEYFEWRKYYDIHIRQGFAGFRRMCYALQANDQRRQKIYSNMDHWWNKLGKCEANVKPVW